ncbi:MAG: protein kinase [Planctomycetes bacterium]|nr:protein kinase [Planctomycetota bacterium]
MSAFQLTIIFGPDKDKAFTMQEGTSYVLGRSQDASFRLNDMRASRTHCEIVWHGERVRLSDRGSSGGTFVNGMKVSQTFLKPGDHIKVGETVLRLQIEDPAGASTVTGLEERKQSDSEVREVEGLAALVGKTLAKYEIGPVIGKGESSRVFRAKDTSDGKEVALKVMHPSFSSDDDEMQRFVRGMKAMLPLRHPNLVTVYTAGKTGPYCWVAMELVEGESITEIIRRTGVAGMLEWKNAFRICLQIARALEYAHSQGIIHRNVAPPNILVRSSDKVAKLGDLMLAKALDGILAQQITKPGELVGDVNYLSPERTRSHSEKIDGRSDLFSLGATTYALLTGKPPFAGSNLVETITKIRNAEPDSPRKFQMGVPGLFEGVVLKMLAKAPEHRYQTAAEVVGELERIGKFQGVSA